MLVRLAGPIGGAHDQRMDHGRLGRRQPLAQVGLVELIHQKADGAPMHAVDRLAGPHQRPQRLQHESVAAERHHHIRGLGLAIAVMGDEPRMRLKRFRARARHKGDLFVSAAH